MEEEDKDNTSVTSVTTAKTLWTETILEILYQTLRTKKPDADLKKVLKEVIDKGFRPSQIVAKVEKKVDKQAALRVKGLLQKP